MIILAQASLMNGHCVGACVCVWALENQKVVSVIGRHPWYKRTGRWQASSRTIFMHLRNAVGRKQRHWLETNGRVVENDIVSLSRFCPKPEPILVEGPFQCAIDDFSQLHSSSRWAVVAVVVASACYRAHAEHVIADVPY